MGQKINPLGFRLGTSQSPYSLWFAEPKKYLKGILDDDIIRYYIKYYVQKHMTSSVGALIRIEIKKETDLTSMLIYVVPTPPQVFNKHFQEESKNLQPNLQKNLSYGNKKLDSKSGKLINVLPKLNLTLKKVREPYRHPTMLAQYITFQLGAKIPVRKAMKRAIELAQQAKTKGIQVQIAGRIGGKEIARVEWIRDGRVPLQTIQAKIDYGCYPIPTIYGLLGIKIWICIDGD